MTLPELIERMSVAPGRRCWALRAAGFPSAARRTLVVFDPDKEIVVDASRFLSRGKNTRRLTARYFGEIELTLVAARRPIRPNKGEKTMNIMEKLAARISELKTRPSRAGYPHRISAGELR